MRVQLKNVAHRVLKPIVPAVFDAKYDREFVKEIRNIRGGRIKSAGRNASKKVRTNTASRL